MSPRAARWALGALLAWAFLVRAFFAWPGPGPARFYDERFAVENIRHVLVSGHIEPVNGFHPELSWLPTAGFLGGIRAAHRLLGAERDPFFDGRGRLTPAFYRWGRLFHVGLGVLSIFLAWRLGRRIAGRLTGVLAAAWLSFFPWHVRFSGILNEDMPQLVACELALIASLAALRAGALRRFVVAGAAIGVALATKFSAGPVALPLAVGAARLRGSWSARIGKTALAALVAAGTLVAVSPHLVLRSELYRRDFGVTVRLYETKGERKQVRGEPVPVDAMRDLAGPLYFGTPGGLLVIAGLSLGVLAARRRPRSWRRAALATATFPILFVAIYSAASDYSAPHIWLPVAPALAVAAGFGARELVRASGRRGRLASRSAIGLLVLAPLAVAAWRSHRMVYEQTVPTCVEDALQAASRGLGRMRPRLVGVDPALREQLGSEWQGRRDRLVLVPAPADAEPSVRGRWDAEIVAVGPEEASGSEPDGEFRPSFLRRRGRAATLILRRWTPAGPPRPVARAAGPGARGSTKLVLPGARGGGLVSLTIHLRSRAARAALRAEGAIELRLATGARPRFFARRLPGGRVLLVGERFDAVAAGRSVELVYPAGLRGLERPNVQLWLWHAPREGLSRPRSPGRRRPG